MKTRSFFLRKTACLAATAALAIFVWIIPGYSHAAIYSTDNLKIYGDFRTRLEVDWDSKNSSGVKRDDRTRLRIRARAGLQYDPDETFSYGIRLRTGSDESHQSPHITIVDFDDNDTGDSDVNFDKWFFKAKRDAAWTWVGRNSFPFWKQNEFFWDDDVTPAGLALGYKASVGENGTVAMNAGYFSLPVGMQEFAGNLGGGQLVYSWKAKGFKLTGAGGIYAFDANPKDSDAAALLNTNGNRDYAIWVGSIQAKTAAGRWPLTLGADVMINNKDYSSSDPDPFTAANHDQTKGYVASVKLGQLKQHGDWLAAYYYARIETFAVNSSYAQDDWVRWGSANETRSSNMKGHEIRLAYAFSKNVNLVGRLYLTDAITSVEDGNRFRIDFNYKF